MQELYTEYEQGVARLWEQVGILRKQAKAARGGEYLRIQREIRTLQEMIRDMNYALNLMARYLGYRGPRGRQGRRKQPGTRPRPEPTDASGRRVKKGGVRG